MHHEKPAGFSCVLCVPGAGRQRAGTSTWSCTSSWTLPQRLWLVGEDYNWPFNSCDKVRGSAVPRANVGVAALHDAVRDFDLVDMTVTLNSFSPQLMNWSGCHRRGWTSCTSLASHPRASYRTTQRLCRFRTTASSLLRYLSEDPEICDNGMTPRGKLMQASWTARISPKRRSMPWRGCQRAVQTWCVGRITRLCFVTQPAC